MVDFSLVVFSQLTEKLLARMPETGRTKAKSRESSNLTRLSPCEARVVDLGYINCSSRCEKTLQLLCSDSESLGGGRE